MAARHIEAGAGLVTVATAKSALPVVSMLGMESMTEALPETEEGSSPFARWTAPNWITG